MVRHTALPGVPVRVAVVYSNGWDTWRRSVFPGRRGILPDVFPRSSLMRRRTRIIRRVVGRGGLRNR